MRNSLAALITLGTIAVSARAQAPLLTVKLAESKPEYALRHLSSLSGEIERERVLRVAYAAALGQDPDVAAEFLPTVLDKPWLAELSFHDACELAAGEESALPPGGGEKLVLATGLKNPALALREREWYAPLSFGRSAFVRFVTAAPDEAERLAYGDSKPARAMRDALTAADTPIANVILRLSEAPGIDLPTRARAATLAGQIARGRLSVDAAVLLASNSTRFFAAVADLRVRQPGSDWAAYDRALEEASLELCREAQESPGRAISADLAGFRAIDLYLLLTYGQSEAPPAVFEAVFDRLLLPKLRAENPRGKSLLEMLRRSGDLELRDFAAGAIGAHRFDEFLQIVGSDGLAKLAGHIAEAADPLKEATRLAQILDATSSRELLRQMAAIVVSEYRRCAEAGNRSGRMLYGLLAARLIESPAADAALREAGSPYLPFLTSSANLALSAVFDGSGHSVQRYFFYDDDDGVASFESFRRSYANDPAWTIEDRGAYLHLTGRGSQRQIEIFANVPVNAHLPANRAFENESQRRQQTIAAALAERGLVPRVLVHRGHAFWVEHTLSYISSTDRLVILGSCGGTEEIHKVLEISHDAQVIATRGVGATEVNDPMLKALNDRLLHGGPVLEWSAFWQAQRAALGHTGLFRDYLAPDQDPGSVFLRSYYRAMDAADPRL
ncbi:MAG TPA: hypothetical protein VMH81_31830 [Bryobacteraceae bacterium]|nr:hypothetical protein [Bryobacteraceae bacterium]